MIYLFINQVKFEKIKMFIEDDLFENNGYLK
jgi:hypothetical protein